MRSTAVSALHEPPFAARRHADTDEVAAQSLDWARHLGLVDAGARWHRLRRAAGPHLHGRPYHSRRHLRHRRHNDRGTWLVVVDDACD